eukprot:CAMPEP_0170186936 /NCGR_PEP_ID=MMETSP0040_2-20121228/40502_1 /TAXON_ID=641309 /ORGANISM="Lotharella oceanica, Strain CCMP622" /LENGTH=43 /DNA_ID= /DNA_START= /DNA_END= /DNA_ORIENTATION=
MATCTLQVPASSATTSAITRATSSGGFLNAPQPQAPSTMASCP